MVRSKQESDDTKREPSALFGCLYVIGWLPSYFFIKWSWYHFHKNGEEWMIIDMMLIAFFATLWPLVDIMLLLGLLLEWASKTPGW